MRYVIVPTIVVALLAIPVCGRADDQNVQSLIGQLRPRAAGQPIVTRGLPKPGAQGVATAPAEHPAVHASAPAEHPVVHASAPAEHPVVHASAPVEPPAVSPAAADGANLNVPFPSGSADITPPAARQLDILGRALTDPSMGASHFLIEGHTDTVGDRATNQSLSERRAAAVVGYLVSKFHIPADHLTAKGVGPDALLVPTPDQTPEPRNRRVHVVNLDG